MVDIKRLTPQQIKQLSYTDFIALVNQWNVLPGSYSTLSKWAQYSRLNNSSYLLSVACTTGFTLRELALISKCKGVGIDIHAPSVEMARYNQKRYAPSAKIKYLKKDAYRFKTDKLFSHIEIGAALKFFFDPKRLLNKIVTLLEDGGFILASPFYVIKPVPQSLIKRAKRIFGIAITIESYKEIMNSYRGFEIIFEERNGIFQETEDELKHYCDSTIKRACIIQSIKDEQIYQAMFQRLYRIKKMSNDLRPYQNYTVLVLRYRKCVYPNRFVELF